MNRYKISETENGFYLEYEWDCTEGGIEKTAKVFEGEDCDLLSAFDKMAKFIRESYQD